MIMNGTIVFLNLLVATISVAKPIDDRPTEGIDVKIDDEISTRSSDNAENILSALLKDDVLSKSDLTKIYNSLESIFAKTRYLKEQPENDAFKKPELIEESRNAKISKTAESSLERRSTIIPKAGKSKVEPRLDSEVESRADSKVEARADSKVESRGDSKVEPRDDSKVEPKNYSKMEPRTVSKAESKTSGEVEIRSGGKLEHRSGSKQESKTVDESKKSNNHESTTKSFRIDLKDTDYLENDNIEVDDKAAPNKALERSGQETFNDESNSNWDLLDDIPATRRMFSTPPVVNLDVKGKSANEHTDITQPRTPMPNIKLSNNADQNDPSWSRVIGIPRAFPGLKRRHLQIIPGYIRIQPAIPIDFRRIISLEREKEMNQDTFPDTAARAEIEEPKRVEEKDDEDIYTDDLSNAYPYTPSVDGSPERVPNVNTIFTKLAQASEHPQSVAPNFNIANLKPLSYKPYTNLIPNYFYPPNYDIYKYINGFGVLPQYPY